MTFSGIGLTTDVTEEQLDVLQEFFCDICGHKGTSTNDMRFKLYCSKQGKLEAKSIPPCLDSLKCTQEEQRSKHLFGASVLFQNLLFHLRWIMDGKWLKMRLSNH